jgi:uncharacterized damage-inducible protein DinB
MEFLRELKVEAPASRTCLERIPENIWDWKPHAKSMQLGYLSLLVSEIPRWIQQTIEIGEIDFATYSRFQPQNTAELVNHFDQNLLLAKNALRQLSDEKLQATFSLKNQGQLLFSAPVGESISQSLNHWVHHRGQLTVYMRLNDIPVPSIYGPSADDRVF